MKKELYILGFAFTLSFLLISLVFLLANFEILKIKEQLISFELNGKTYLLKEAKTPQEWEKGLMFVKKPVNFDGMIFLFPEKKIRTFWNKNTFLDLEIIWLDDDKIVGKDFLPSIESSKEIVTKTSPAPVNKVIELIK
jgi:uncharacterized membrane protein (UPF0127 family)